MLSPRHRVALMSAPENSQSDAHATGAPPAVLSLSRIALTDYRCYASLRLTVDARPVVLTGPNGAGKTNLLEAVSFLSPGRGLRRERLARVGRRGATGPWTVAARLATPAGRVDIGTGLAAPGDGEAAGSEQRLVKIDGRRAAGPAALAGVVGMAWLTPQMDRLFLDGAAPRRRFLDRIVFGFEPEHARRAADYERAMRQRSRLLKDGARDQRWLAALEGAMAEQGVALAAARRHWLGRLEAALAEAAGPFPAPGVAVAGALEDWLDTMPALAAEDRVRAALAAGRARDGEAGGAGVGPHRTDLVVRHRAKDLPAAQCSTGEQKALLVALVLATARLQAAERGVTPVLLLDEVTAHLDDARRDALFEAILALGAQAWLSGTDRSLFEGLGGRAQYFTVHDGRVTPSSGDAR